MAEGGESQRGLGDGVVRFRNYRPEDVELQSTAQAEPAVAPELHQPRENERSGPKEGEASALATTKANADLKKLAKPKVDVVEARTQRAIAEILREQGAEH
jgi:hypothetical protein